MGFVFGSSRALNRIFAPSPGRRERYTGIIDKFGVDIGYTAAAVIVWGVIAPTANLAPGSLAGNYAGASAGAAVGAGLGANALIGGSNQQFALQPLSIEGQTGLQRCGRDCVSRPPLSALAKSPAAADLAIEVGRLINLPEPSPLLDPGLLLRVGRGRHAALPVARAPRDAAAQASTPSPQPTSETCAPLTSPRIRCCSIASITAPIDVVRQDS